MSNIIGFEHCAAFLVNIEGPGTIYTIPFRSRSVKASQGQKQVPMLPNEKQSTSKPIPKQKLVPYQMRIGITGH